MSFTGECHTHRENYLEVCCAPYFHQLKITCSPLKVATTTKHQGTDEARVKLDPVCLREKNVFAWESQGDSDSYPPLCRSERFILPVFYRVWGHVLSQASTVWYCWHNVFQRLYQVVNICSYFASPCHWASYCYHSHFKTLSFIALRIFSILSAIVYNWKENTLSQEMQL